MPLPSFHGSVAFNTSHGTLLFALFGRSFPIACENITRLVGMGYYDGSRVTRIVRDNFAEISVDAEVVGDWTATGVVTGNASHRVRREADATTARPSSVIVANSHRVATRVDTPGLLLLAYDDEGGAASRLLLTLADRNLDYLLRSYAVIGSCIHGGELLRRMNAVALERRFHDGRSSEPALLDGEPVRVLRIRRAVVVDDPFGGAASHVSLRAMPATPLDETCARFNFADWARARQRSRPAARRPFLDEDAGSASTEGSSQQPPRRLRYNADELYGGLSSGEDDDPLVAGGSGLTAEEVSEHLGRVARTRTMMLQLLGALPESATEDELAPPENVLFVCKLNPLTQDADLATCFRQFGNVKSCEIIRDAKTGRSLNYAFVEFESKAQCERAYKKMDNVLIDDARIHVDFSQSVPKLWTARRRQGPRGVATAVAGMKLATHHPPVGGGPIGARIEASRLHAAKRTRSHENE